MKKILLSSVVAIALLTGCGEDKKVVETKPAVEVKVEEVKKVEPVKAVEVKTPETKLVEQVKESTSKVATQIAEESKKVAAVGTEAVKSVSEKVMAKTEEVSKVVAKKAEETKDKIEESINTIVATKTEAKDSTADAGKGKGLYLKCAGCHGQNGEKEALGKSQVIKGWEASKVVTALKGYKDGSYGGVMKGVMKSQVANLSDEEVDALGAFISTL